MKPRRLQQRPAITRRRPWDERPFEAMDENIDENTTGWNTQHSEALKIWCCCVFLGSWKYGSWNVCWIYTPMFRMPEKAPGWRIYMFRFGDPDRLTFIFHCYWVGSISKNVYNWLAVAIFQECHCHHQDDMLRRPGIPSYWEGAHTPCTYVRWLEIVWCNLEGIQTSFKNFFLPALFWRWDGLKVQIGICNFGKQCVHFNTVHFNTCSQKTSSVNASKLSVHAWPPVFPKTNWCFLKWWYPQNTPKLGSTI